MGTCHGNGHGHGEQLLRTKSQYRLMGQYWRKQDHSSRGSRPATWVQSSLLREALTKNLSKLEVGKTKTGMDKTNISIVTK